MNRTVHKKPTGEGWDSNPIRKRGRRWGPEVPNRFVHLQACSYFSLLAGLHSPEALVARAAEFGQPALALTDENNMFGAMRFYRAATAAGVKPIFGLRLAVAFDESDGHPSSLSQLGTPKQTLTLLAKSATGYRNLLRLATAVRTEPRRIRRAVGPSAPAALRAQTVSRTSGSAYDADGAVEERLFFECADGLIVLVGSGGAGRGATASRTADDCRVVERLLHRLDRSDVYVQLQNQRLSGQAEANGALSAWARKQGVGVVATNDVRYVAEDDARAHAALLALGARTTLDDADRPTMGSAAFYLASAEEMRDRFPHEEEALANASLIAERCNVDFDDAGLRLPLYTDVSGVPPTKDTVADEDAAQLIKRARAGAKARFGDTSSESVRARLDHELDIICNRGLASYFLIVSDIVDEARRRGIPVGPGRGSAASSLVAYCLRITAVDPIAHGLVFERFLNPERLRMPDIDIDVGDTGRDELLDYIRRRFGEERVAQIVTFGTLAARAAVREAGRALGADEAAGRIARLIPTQSGITLADAAAQTAPLTSLLASDREAGRVWALAEAVEGVPRHVSVHAAGVVIGDGPLQEDMPLMQTAEGTRITQFAMDDVEALGFLKMDVLGLRTLTVIEQTRRFVGGSDGPVDEGVLGGDDDTVYEALRRHGTDGVFQLETPMFRNLVRKLQPGSFDDIVALLALGRPGPMQRVDEFIRRRHGRTSPTYVHPAVEPILQETYGIIVYQEQVMHIAMHVAGYSPAEADLLRRRLTDVGGGGTALSEQERARFLDGAMTSGLSRGDAERVLAQLLQFAGYGFAKSHSVAYAMLTYETAWLRIHHPSPFLAALLNAHMNSPERVRRYAGAARAWGTRLLDPDVNRSGVIFEPVCAEDGQGAVVYGLAALRHVGRGLAEAVVQARTDGPFRSFEDFRRRLPTTYASGRGLEALVRAGACDVFGEDRAHMLRTAGASASASPRDQRSLFVGKSDGPRAVRSFPADSAETKVSDMLNMPGRALVLQLSDGHKSDWSALQKVLAAHNGDVPVTLQVPVDGALVDIAVERRWWVDDGASLRKTLRKWLDEGRLTAVRRLP